MMHRFPLILQHDSMQCGVACLAMICSHYGRDYPLGALSQYCSPTAEGVSLLAISDAAEKLGLHATAGRTITEHLSSTVLPCILHWRQNHFVVLYRLRGRGGKQKYFIADPAKGLDVYSRDDFLEAWASTGIGGQDGGVALFLKPTPEFYSRPQEECQPQRSFRFLLGYIRQYRRYFGQIVLGLLLGCILQLIMPFLTQAIVDVGIRGENLRLIWLILTGELMIVARTHGNGPHKEMAAPAHQYEDQHLTRQRLLHQATEASHGIFRHQTHRRPHAAHLGPL